MVIAFLGLVKSIFGFIWQVLLFMWTGLQAAGSWLHCVLHSVFIANSFAEQLVLFTGSILFSPLWTLLSNHIRKLYYRMIIFCAKDRTNIIKNITSIGTANDIGIKRKKKAVHHGKGENNILPVKRTSCSAKELAIKTECSTQ